MCYQKSTIENLLHHRLQQSVFYIACSLLLNIIKILIYPVVTNISITIYYTHDHCLYTESPEIRQHNALSSEAYVNTIKQVFVFIFVFAAFGEIK